MSRNLRGLHPHVRISWAADPRAAALRPAEAARQSQRLLSLVQIGIGVYAVGSLGLIATHRVGLTSEHAILLLLAFAGLVPRMRGLVRDWLPFLFVAVMFEDLGAVQPLISGSVHAAGPAAFERSVLGVNAGPWLEAHLGGLQGPRWWQLPLVAEYLAHFVAPLAAGGYLWWRHRSLFGQFVAAYTLVMAAGFGVYVVFPEMPPWLAAQHGLVEPVQRVVVAALGHLGGVGRMYAGADLFPNGAMPSLHVAVPMVIALALVSARGRGAARWLWLLYPLTIAFAVVDLGEHYVADAVVGAAFGVLCWGLVAGAPVLLRRPVVRPLPPVAPALGAAVTRAVRAAAPAARQPGLAAVDAGPTVYRARGAASFRPPDRAGLG